MRPRKGAEMTVKELREALEGYGDHLEVQIEIYSGQLEIASVGTGTADDGEAICLISTI
jgi:hypothetical protein